MKTGILITARLGSTRLAKKHLLAVAGKPIIHYLLCRINRAFNREINDGDVEVIISSSDEPENREFEIFNPLGIMTFYGAVNNIPYRHLQTADSRFLDSIIAIDGDDILCSVEGMRRVYDHLLSGKHYVKTSGLPFGMNSFGYSVHYLRKSVQKHVNRKLETGWGRIFNQDEVIDIPFDGHKSPINYRFTLDYELDYVFFRAIIEYFGDKVYEATDREIIDHVEKNNLQEINRSISDQYWKNVNNEIDREETHRIKEMPAIPLKGALYE